MVLVILWFIADFSVTLNLMCSMFSGEKVSMVATTVSSQILKTMARAEGFKYDVCINSSNFKQYGYRNIVLCIVVVNIF